jgi:hypothetical protein
VSLPTSEAAGAQAYEHSDGVGALPGRVGEEGIVILPDEKALGDVSSSTQETDTQTTKDSSKDNILAASVLLPSSGAHPYQHDGKVDPLPGDASEEGVAKLSHERALENPSESLIICF